jgi:hypothetical protein
MHNTRHAIGETPHWWHLHETGPSCTPWEGVFLPVVCYSPGMLTFLQPQNIVPKAGRWILLVGPRSLNTSVLDAIARLGERTPVRVLDGGNRFNAYKVARAAHGRPETLGRITVSRAFTCYQAHSLLEATPLSPFPFIVLDLLNTFYDESVQVGERKRLLKICISHLERLEVTSGGVVSIHPPAVPSQTAVEMLELLQASAGESIFVQPEPGVVQPMRLF